MVRGWSNKKVSETLGITEQQVANYTFDFIASMTNAIRKWNVETGLISELAD